MIKKIIDLIKFSIEKVCTSPASIKSGKEIILVDHTSEIVMRKVLPGGDFSG